LLKFCSFFHASSCTSSLRFFLCLNEAGAFSGFFVSEAISPEALLPSSSPFSVSFFLRPQFIESTFFFVFSSPVHSQSLGRQAGRGGRAFWSWTGCISTAARTCACLCVCICCKIEIEVGTAVLLSSVVSFHFC